jgi:hypothetical protein
MKQFEIDRHRNMSTQLGMPRGTAANRLRKLVLFDLLKRHNENICYRCKKNIEQAEDLSIEHIKPWEHVDVALFWDLSNIAFSHLRCNCAAARRPVVQLKHRRTAPEGMNWCRTHKQFLPVDRFSTQPSRWNGLCYDCKDCTNTAKREARRSPDGVMVAPPPEER